MNNHIERGYLPSQIVEVIDSFMASCGGLNDVFELPLPKLVEASTHKFIIFNQKKKPYAFLILSSSKSPDSVFENARKAKEIAELLPDNLASSILVPNLCSYSGGKSFSVGMFYRTFSKNMLIRKLQLILTRKSMLRWLYELNELTLSKASDSEIASEFVSPLEFIVNHPKISQNAKDIARKALYQLSINLWQPYMVMAHNDLWYGNFLIDNDNPYGMPFKIIDWEGSRLRGHGFYDLIRLAYSVSLSKDSFNEELEKHFRLFECSKIQSKFYLLAALGSLGSNLGNWQEKRFVDTVNESLRYID